MEETKISIQQGTNATSEASWTTTGDDSDGVWTEIQYTVKDPKHDLEKPYDIRYDTNGTIPMTNTTSKAQNVFIRDFTPSLRDVNNFNTYGFSVEKLGCNLTAAIFDNKKSIKNLFYPEIKKILWKTFPSATSVYILEHNLRKRVPEFPSLGNASELEYTQPATIAHIDCSLASVIRTGCTACEISIEQCQRVVSVNFWKSLQGPGNDWPLALCDSRTMYYDSDTVVTDIVYHNRFTENAYVYHNQRHQWYYVKDLEDDQITMFMQKDSELEGGGGVAHSSFYNSKADSNAPPRMSIELRTYVVFT